MSRHPSVAVLLAGLALCASGFAALAAEPAHAAPIPVEDFARQPTLRSVTFSPNGLRFAAVRESGGRMNLVVGDLKTKSLQQLTSYKTYDVGSLRWISDRRLMHSTYDAKKGLAEWRSIGVVAIDWDGGEPRNLSLGRNWDNSESLWHKPQLSFFQRIPGSEDEILATGSERDVESLDLYRFNTRTGRKVLLSVDSPGRVTRWVVDKDDVPRAAISRDERRLSEIFWYRDDAKSPWRKIASYERFAARMRPAGFDTDGTLLVYSNLGSDRFQLREFDAAKGAPGPVVIEHATADIDSGLVKHPVTKQVLGVYVDADQSEAVWFEESYAKLQALMDVSLPKGNRHAFTPLANGNVLVFSSSDRDPGRYYLYDPQTHKLEEQLRPTDWIQPERMAPTQVVRYKARDGLEIPSYLTLPQNAAGKKMPLVAWIHGGPWARDHWGYDPDVQFMASRGYAVWQPNYRGSTGFGSRHYAASFKQVGQAMQDDITDGIRHLVAQGIVDPDRVCIGGGSYGGYATMMGLVKEPSMFRCGINEVGVTDMIWWHELGYTDYNLSDAYGSAAFLNVTIGNPKTDREMMEKYSPRLHADKIKAPVLIVHGAGDQRVPIQHATGMRDALKAAGKEYEWVVYDDEGHGYTNPVNRLDRYRKIEAFLAKHLGTTAP